MQKPKQQRMRKYFCTPYQKSALAYLDPPEDMKVSEWAERYRMLDSKTSAEPGPWNNERTPYLVDIMDELLNYETEEIIFCKCTQVGGTEVELNMLGYIELLQEVILDEVYETFIISGVLSGLFNISGFWENKQKYFKHEWVAPPKPWIDPVKEATATKIAMQTGQKTYQQIAAENGKDWKEQIDETVAVLEYAREKGLEMGGVIFDRTEMELTPKRDKSTEQDGGENLSPTEGQAAAGGHSQ